MSESKEKKQAQNLHSETMCSNPDCNWPECAANGESSNRYIIQEITVIGDKPSKVCPVVTDTVNERVLVIERDDTDEKLNKIIDILTAPMGEVVLQMVKSEENVGKVSRSDRNDAKTTSKNENESENAGNASKEGEKDEVKDQTVDRIESKLKVISHKGIETTRVSEGNNTNAGIPLKSSGSSDTLDKTHDKIKKDDVAKTDAMKSNDKGKTSSVSNPKHKQEKPKIDDEPKAQSDINIDETKSQTIPPIQVLPLTPAKVEEKIKDSDSQLADPCNPNVYEEQSSISSDANRVAEPKEASNKFDVGKAVQDIPEGAIKQWKKYLKTQSPDKVESNVDVKPKDSEVNTKEKPVDAVTPTDGLKIDQSQSEEKTKDTPNGPGEIEKKETDNNPEKSVSEPSALPEQSILENKDESVLVEPKPEDKQSQDGETKSEVKPETEKIKSKNKPKRSKKNKNKDKLLDISTKTDLVPEATNVNVDNEPKVAPAETKEEENIFTDIPICIDENTPDIVEKSVEQTVKSEAEKPDDESKDGISNANQNMTEQLKSDEKSMDAAPVSQTTDTTAEPAPAEIDEPKPKDEEKSKDIKSKPKDDVKPDLRETRIPLDMSAKVATKREHEKSMEKCKEAKANPTKIEENEPKREAKSMARAIELPNLPVLSQIEAKRDAISKSDDGKPKIEANVSDLTTKPAVKSKLNEEGIVQASKAVENPIEVKPEIDDEKQGQPSGPDDDEDIHTIVYNIMERVDKLFAKNF